MPRHPRSCLCRSGRAIRGSPGVRLSTVDDPRAAARSVTLNSPNLCPLARRLCRIFAAAVSRPAATTPRHPHDLPAVVRVRPVCPVPHAPTMPARRCGTEGDPASSACTSARHEPNLRGSAKNTIGVPPRTRLALGKGSTNLHRSFETGRRQSWSAPSSATRSCNAVNTPGAAATSRSPSAGRPCRPSTRAPASAATSPAAAWSQRFSPRSK